jgi:hypothetical protein
MKKRLLSLLVLLCCITMARAQDVTADSTKTATTSTSFNPLLATVQVHGGTQGFGVAVRYQFIPQLAARLGGSYGSVNINEGFNFDNLSTDNKLKGKISNIHLFGEYNALNWLRVVAGAGYFFKANANVVMTPNESVTRDGITLQPEELGILTTDVNYKKFAPYIGLGLGRGLPQKRFNANVDFGFYYLSAPTVTMTGTEYLDGNTQNGPILTENMKNYRFLPVVQLNLNFKLSK